ncbi:hypothetical protein PEBR_39187 [Penicillium brasilianum]|uniref:Telomere length regulation/capping, TEN1 n=1 Tax=Penicillium brasilianum TaxID=104259 RepID=A0A1S9RAW7_PENBI|nr:hypothetical protein PEBR_39187 [Penicillium brasilianum]
MNGPRASIRVFLCDLPALATDTKVRFLGCVRQYDVNTGNLILEHNYPRSKIEAESVSVDVNAVLEDLTSEQLRVGAWLNVIGYIRDLNTPTPSFSSSQLSSSQANGPSEIATAPVKVTPRPVHIDAVMVFPAGAIALGEYERILRNAQDVEQRMCFTG